MRDYLWLIVALAGLVVLVTSLTIDAYDDYVKQSELEEKLMKEYQDLERCDDKFDYLKNQGDDWQETYDLYIYRDFVLRCLFN